ncbi:MAG: glycosyltransferase family 2 protein [Elusimicrobiales bacterium]|nr:glycosyltransferase family 2 protein [Elusimicrobiales bacterium]
MCGSTDVIFLFFLLSGNFVQLYFIMCMFLYIFLCVIAIFPYNKKEEDINESDIYNHKFAIVVPAHNEEKVIGNLVESLLSQNYPKDKYDIYVVCDHCRDGTIDVVNKYNVNILIHENNFPSNKAKALNYAINQIFKLAKGYDAFCFFDADSLVHPNFLKYMSYYLSKGYKVIQSQQLPKNPYDSFISKIVSAGQYVTNRFFQKPKMLLGLSATLHGKGMCFKTDIVEKFMWDETCLTEDLEMQMRLVRNGVFIAWGEKSIIYDEEPITIRQYFRRSVRWTKGSIDVARKHALRLFLRFIKYFDFSALEAFLYTVGVYRVLMVVFVIFSLSYTRNHFNLLVWFFNIIPHEEIIMKFVFISIPLVVLPIMIWLEKRISFDMIFAYYMQPFLGIFRVPIFIAGILKSKTIWDTVEHTSSVRIDDIIKKEVV